MNLCVIGNSHVGSLKRAWDEMKGDYRQHRITFFAQRREWLDGLIVRSGKLIADTEALARALEFTSGGKREIDIEDYDVFVVYGVDTNTNFMTANQFYSRAVLENRLNDLVANNRSFQLLQKLRTLTDKTVFIGDVPLAPAVEMLGDATPSDYLARVQLINDVIFRPLNAELVRQPLGTILDGHHTRADFSKGSKRLAVGDALDDECHPENERGHHMNDKFGEMWLREFLNHVASVEHP